MMRRIALYGKGGIGKSTTTSNLSTVLAMKGYTVMQIGCDPKADSTRILTGGKKITPILETITRGERPVDLENLVFTGKMGILCVECGGPTPGVGCAGRGIISAFERLDSLQAFDILKPDYVLYDVLGDVVCGGFAMPLRKGYAEEVYIVTSGEMMSLYAAQNIATAISQFGSKGYARLKGIIQNSKGIDNENEIVTNLASEIGVPVITQIPRDTVVQKYESLCSPVTANECDGPYVQAIQKLADEIITGFKR